MSWWVYLKKNGEAIKVKQQHQEGRTYKIGGNPSAELNITYNYSIYYYKYLDKQKGLRWLNGKKAKNCINQLKIAVKKLGVKQNKDYWKPIKGNAGYALNILLVWAKDHPNAFFTVH